MSEAAYYHDHRVTYGCFPDEDGGPDPDMEGMDFRCPKCNQPSFDSEAQIIEGEKVCCNCADAHNPESTNE